MAKKKQAKTTSDRERVVIDFPIEFLKAIDLAADRVGIPRQSFIKLTLANALNLPLTDLVR